MLAASPIFGCCNEWETLGADNDLVEDKVKHLFEREHIATSKIWIENTGPQIYCFICCKCPRTEIIKVWIDEADQAKAEAIGFQ